MAAFKEHLNIATMAVGVVVITLYSASFLTLYQTFIALFIGILGGILPDIDSSNSTPLRAIFKLFSIVLPLIFLLAFFGVLPIIQTLLLWIAFALLLRVTLFELFLHFTRHRGIFHSIPMAILIGELTTFVAFYVLKIDFKVAVIYGFIIFFGYLVHLLLDEIYSIDAFGVKLKKSFGTAFKLYDKHNILGTICLYIFIILLYFVLPHIDTVMIKLLHLIQNMKWI